MLALFVMLGVATPVELENGVHLRNEDDKPYTLVVQVPLSTRICEARRPVPGIKRGLDVAALRKPKGFRLLKATEPMNGMRRAVVEPKTEVLCLCTTACPVEVVGVGRVDVPNNSTVVITNGKLTFSPPSR